MKFGQTLKAVATSLGMFAAGSWIVPCFSLTSVTQIASAVPISENSNDDTWSGSDVARAWASATGSEYDPASQVLVMQSGEDHVPVVLDQVRSEDGRSVGLSYFMVDLSLPVAEASQQDEEFGVTTGAEFVTGRILGALDHPGYFSGVRFSMLAESGLSSNAPTTIASQPAKQSGWLVSSRAYLPPWGWAWALRGSSAKLGALARAEVQLLRPVSCVWQA